MQDETTDSKMEKKRRFENGRPPNAKTGQNCQF